MRLPSLLQIVAAAGRCEKIISTITNINIPLIIFIIFVYGPTFYGLGFVI